MKKTIFSLAILGLVWLGSATTLEAQSNATHTSTVAQQKHNWRKSSDGTWTGKYNGTEYNYRMKNGKLQEQYNNGEWSDVKSNQWYDSNGKMYSYRNHAVSSSSNGSSWSNVNGSMWQGNNGYWYKMDNQGNLWWDNSAGMNK
jgi:hypothetical protein